MPAGSTLGANGRNDSRYFHPDIEPITGIEPAGVGNDRAVTERARPHFLPPLEPTDDLPRSMRVATSAATLSGFENARPRALSEACSSSVGVSRPPEGVGHAWPRRPAVLEVHECRSAQGRAGVVGHRLHPDALEGRPAAIS